MAALQTGDLDCIDDFADALSQAVDDAEGDEDELQAVLSQLEDLVVEDIVRTSDLQVGDNDGSQPGVCHVSCELLGFSFLMS